MNLDLTGRRAIVCGSTQGIGLAAAREIALLGASVTLVARDEAALSDAAGGLDSSKGQRHGHAVADFANPNEVRTAAQRVAAEGAVHILVNNTGGPPGGPALEAGIEEYRRAFEMHLVCNQILAQATTPGMKEAGFGRIVNVLSTSVREPIPNLGVSNTIRGAVAQWAKTLSRELGPFGITVNNVLPGFTDTARLGDLFAGKARREGKTAEQVEQEMKATIPLGRLGRPEEIGAAIAFLCSPAGGYISGVHLAVDGGRLHTH